MNVCMYVGMYVFIHYEYLYSASSRLLLRSTPNPCTAKKNSFQFRVECVGKNHGEPGLWKNRQKEPRVIPPFYSAEGTATSGARGGTAKSLYVCMYVRIHLVSLVQRKNMPPDNNVCQ